jgi:RNA polymerase sigma-70 factor (ECF subfamily)
MDLEAEKKLVKKAQQDPEAFSLLYEDNYSKIFNYVLKRTANVEITQDVTSETFFKALKNVKRFSWKNISFSCWLYRIASNEIVNYFRKNKYKCVSFDKIAEPSSSSTPQADVMEAEDELKKQKDFLEIHQKISELPDIYQKVIVLRFFEKKMVKEIAEILGKKEGTIKSLIHRGLEKLRKLIK